MSEGVWNKMNNPYAKQALQKSNKVSPTGSPGSTSPPETSPKLPTKPPRQSTLQQPPPIPDVKKKPPVPARPAHTMSVYSTDLPKDKPATPSRPDETPSGSSIAARAQAFEQQAQSHSAGKKPPPKPHVNNNYIDGDVSAPKPVGNSNNKPTQPAANQVGATGVSDGSVPRARPKQTASDDVVERLKAICNPADPTKLYKSLVKIGQG